MSKKSELIPGRLSHLLRHCSVGAIVRGPDYLMTVKDIREWTDKQGNAAGDRIRYVDRVCEALGITQELREPPVAQEMANCQIDGVCVPALRFPSWMRCPKCGLLHYQPWKGLNAGEAPRCQEGDQSKCQKRPELEQVPWILLHKEGHMADVPWHSLTHAEVKKQEGKNCRRDWTSPYLRLIDQGASQRRLRCGSCGAESPFFDSIRIPFGNAWRQPWFREEADIAEGVAEILEINDARVHSPVTCNALVIPPESRIRKGSVVDRLYRNSQKLRQIEQARTPLAKKGALTQLASEFRCSVADVEDALREIEKGYPSYEMNITSGLLLESEYRAFLDELPDMADDEDFVTRHHTPAWKSLAEHLPEHAKSRRILKAISRLIAVNRLKEILVLKGFKRLGQDGTLVPPDIIGESAWLPALELYGEGVFFNLDENVLSQWESHPSIQQRAVDTQRRFVATNIRVDPEVLVTPRFLLLHTLAHLLIRQLETQAGYPAASLKERIYCTAGKLPMAGILVYVAVPDVIGSLGGLAELAVPDRLLPLLSSIFDHAEWCSLDPVCSEHEGQGPSLLNRAACHACALIPEPSCAYGNVLLDRTFIKGDVVTGMPGFLDVLDLHEDALKNVN